jgi:pyruvate dehydrogenase E1 component beta subunit
MSAKPYVEALNGALHTSMEADGSVLLVGTNVRAIKSGLYKKFGGERVIDIPPSDDGGVGLALGLAQTGARPVLEIDGEYLLRAADAIANQAALADFMYNGQYASSMVMLAYTGFVKNASPQASQSWEALFCHIPALTVVMPSDPKDLSDTLQAAVNSASPVLFLIDKSFLDAETQSAEAAAENTDTREDAAAEETAQEAPQALELGKARVAVQGEDVTLVTYGAMTQACLEAAEKAGEIGVSCEVIDLVTLHPIDRETITRSVSKTGKVIIAHLAHKTGGLGSEVSATIAEGPAFNYLEQPIMRICAEDMPVGYADAYRACVLPCAEDVYSAILNLTE